MKHCIVALILFITATCTCLGCNSAEMESNSHLNDGIRSYEKKIHDKATQSFQNAINRYPNNHKAYYYMALLDMDYRDYTNAKKNLQLAIGYAPKEPIYHFKLAIANTGEAQNYQLMGDSNMAYASYQQCINALDKVISIDKYYAEAHLQMARCYIGIGNYLSAVTAFEKSIEADPFLENEEGATVHYKELGELYTSFGFYKEAINVLTNGILNNTDDGQLETTLAYVYLGMKEHLNALAHFEGAYKLLNKTAESKLHTLSAMFGIAIANYEMGKINYQEGNLREAFDRYANAKKWFGDYIHLAVTQEEELRKAGAVAKIQEIEEIMKEENI